MNVSLTISEYTKPVTLTLFLSVFILLLAGSNTSFALKQDFTAIFEHQAIVVSDLETSAKFYQEVLGLKEVENKTKLPTRRWFSLGENQELHLLLEDEHEIELNKYVHMAVAIANYDAFIENLRSNNISFSSWDGTPNKITIRPDGVRQVYLQDPDDYWIEINSNAK